MATREPATALLIGVAAGLAGGLFGVGGGIVLVPLLATVLHLSQHQAHGTSLAAIGATAIASLVVYGMHGNVAWGTAALVGVASMLTARYGARLAARTSTRDLRRAFAIFLVLVALRLLWKAPAAAGSPFHGLPLTVGFDLLLGAMVGVLAGFMGVGGGLLAVPAFALVLGMSQQAAQGTSLAVILLTAPAGAYEHHRHGNVVLRIVPWLALGAAAGGPAASWLAQRLPQAILARAFALFLLANVIHLWVRSGAGGKTQPLEKGQQAEQ
jgi:uncharacterized protein